MLSANSGVWERDKQIHSLWVAQALSLAVGKLHTQLANASRQALFLHSGGVSWDWGAGGCRRRGSTDNESGRNGKVGELHLGIIKRG